MQLYTIVLLTDIYQIVCCVTAATTFKLLFSFACLSARYFGLFLVFACLPSPYLGLFAFADRLLIADLELTLSERHLTWAALPRNSGFQVQTLTTRIVTLVLIHK